MFILLNTFNSIYCLFLLFTLCYLQNSLIIRFSYLWFLLEKKNRNNCNLTLYIIFLNLLPVKKFYKFIQLTDAVSGLLDGCFNASQPSS